MSFVLVSPPRPITSTPLVTAALVPAVMADLGYTVAQDDDGAIRGYLLDDTVICIGGTESYSHTYATRADALFVWCLI